MKIPHPGGARVQRLHVAYCDPCGKLAYCTRADARARIREMGEKGLRAYRCPAVPALFHLGHLPGEVRRGAATAAEVYARRDGGPS